MRKKHTLDRWLKVQEPLQFWCGKRPTRTQIPSSRLGNYFVVVRKAWTEKLDGEKENQKDKQEEGAPKEGRGGWHGHCRHHFSRVFACSWKAGGCGDVKKTFLPETETRIP